MKSLGMHVPLRVILIFLVNKKLPFLYYIFHIIAD